MESGNKLAKEYEYDLHFKQADYEKAVDRCKQYIRDGDIMQVVISQRLSTPYQGNPIDVYRALRTINPSPYMYFWMPEIFKLSVRHLKFLCAFKMI